VIISEDIGYNVKRVKEKNKYFILKSRRKAHTHTCTGEGGAVGSVLL
jgi:hypothetical protein